MSRYTRYSIEIALRLDQDEGQLGDIVTTEAVVEGGVSEALAKLCDGTIIVDNVTVSYSREPSFYEDDLPDRA